MIDRFLLPAVKAALTPPARMLERRGVQADHITLAGFAIGALALPALALGWHLIALVLILANRLTDGLDGTLARLRRPTDRGAFLDIGLDFQFYALVPLGFALADPTRNALPAAVLLACFIGTGSSFLAYAVLAERRKQPLSVPDKGFYYLGGLTEGGETILAFVLMCLFPGSFPAIALIFSAACALTFTGRVAAGWRAFADGPEGPGG